MKRYTQEQIDYLKKIIPGHYHKEIIGMFRNKYPNEEFNEYSLKNFINRYKVSSGITGHFVKGHTPPNKGKKGYCNPGSEKGWFKKGYSRNKLPVGSIRVRKGKSHRISGDLKEVFIKVAEPNKWRLYSRVLWEQHHGSIPKGMVVAFRDGDTTNVVIENLRLISRGTLAVMNSKGYLYDGEARDVGITMAELKSAISKKQRKIKNGEE